MKKILLISLGILFFTFSSQAQSTEESEKLHYKSKEAKDKFKPGKVYSLGKEGDVIIQKKTKKSEASKIEEQRLEAIKSKED